MSGAFAWLGRLAVLSLSLLATLSIIGSIAAIPSGSVEGRLGLERPPGERTVAPATEPRERRMPSEPEMPQPGTGASQIVESIAIPVAPERDDPLRWLEPLTYALIALAGFMALGVLFLWQAVAALNRLERR